MSSFYATVFYLEKHSQAFIAIAALLSPFVALFAALLVSRSNLKGVELSHRREWIKEVRDEIAMVLADTMHATSEKNAGLSQEQRLIRLAALNLHVNKIKLLLDPSAKDQSKLLPLLNEFAAALSRYLNRETLSHEELSEAGKRIATAAQKIIAREWNKR